MQRQRWRWAAEYTRSPPPSFPPRVKHNVQNPRERSISNRDANIIKIKRSETPEDIESAILKDEIFDKVDDAENGGEVEEIKDDDEIENGSRGRRRRVSHGFHLVEGKMKHGMEDYLVATCKKIGDHELGLYAIFDGHSGRKVAEHLQDRLFDNILDQPDFWSEPKAAVKRAYEATDKYILENVVGSTGGSTAVTAILIDGEKLVVANVGDSRAVLGKNGEVRQLTVDHEPLKEKKMVEKKGGFVSHKPGNVARVDGMLSMARAFGDGRVKSHITSKPDSVVEMIDEDTDCIILASDGVWHVMSNQEAVDCVGGMRDGGEAAQELIREALSRGSKDDISCVVVIFHN